MYNSYLFGRTYTHISKYIFTTTNYTSQTMSGVRRRLPKDALSLRDFLHKSQVLKQYRAFLRELQGLDPTTVAELHKQIKDAYRENANERNRANMKALLAEGERQLVFVRSYIGTARKVDPATIGKTDPTWVGTGDDDDIRGRIGEGWPWGGDENDEKMK